MCNKLTILLVNFIIKYSNHNKKNLVHIKYGIEVFLMNISKIIFLFTAAYLLNILKFTFISFISFGFLRTFACGVHAKNSIKCIVTTFFTFFGIVYVSILFSLNKLSVNVFFLVSLLLLILYALADTEERPLVSKKLRRKLKKLSIFSWGILYLSSLLITDKVIVSILSYSVLTESLIITPLVYNLFRREYKNYEKINF